MGRDFLSPHQDGSRVGHLMQPTDFLAGLLLLSSVETGLAGEAGSWEEQP